MFLYKFTSVEIHESVCQKNICIDNCAFCKEVEIADVYQNSTYCLDFLVSVKCRLQTGDRSELGKM